MMTTMTLKKRMALAAASLLVAGGAVVSMSASASAATVPNRFYCHPSSSQNWCYQMNGTHVNGIPNECHYKNSGMPSSPPSGKYIINKGQCNSWGPPFA